MMDNQEAFTSLCAGFLDENDKRIHLKRIADIFENRITECIYNDCFCSDAILPADNFLYSNNKIKDDIFIIVPLNWAADNGFLKTWYDKESQPAEIIIIPDCNSGADLRNNLLNGIEAEVSKGINRVLFSYSAEGDEYGGILCQVKDTVSEDDDIQENEAVILSYHKFNKSDIYHTGFNGRLFFRNLSLGEYAEEMIFKAIAEVENITNILQEIQNTQEKNISRQEEIDSDIKKQKDILDSLSKQIEDSEKQLTDIKDRIEQYKTLADDMESNVRNKIEEAGIHAETFIDRLADAYAEKSVSLKQSRISENDNISAYTSGGDTVLKEDLEYHSDWEEELRSLEDVLIDEIGIDTDYSLGFAAFLYSSYIHKMPLLLAGVCGVSIANILSILLFGKTAGILDCSYEYRNGIIQEIIDSEDEIIIIKDPFNPQWSYHLPELLMAGKKHFILICPFAEDLIIEPNSWLNYIIPVITDIVVNKVPSGQFKGRIRDKYFEEYGTYDSKDKKDLLNSIRSVNFLRKLNIRNFDFKRIKDIMMDSCKMVGITEENKNDLEDIIYLFIIFPYAYFTEQGSVLAKDLKSQDNTVTKELRTAILKYLREIA